MIYYLMGKSASGKDTLYRRLRELRPDWQEVVLYTTRPMRTGEIEGKTYHFISAERMAELAAAGRLIEARTYQTVCGPWIYATVDDGQIREPESRDYLMIGTLESYVKVRQYYGAALLRPLYIEVPDEVRLARAREREAREAQPRFDEMERRFQADARDFSPEKLAAAGIRRHYLNMDMEKCIDEIIQDTGK